MVLLYPRRATERQTEEHTPPFVYCRHGSRGLAGRNLTSCDIFHGWQVFVVRQTAKRLTNRPSDPMGCDNRSVVDGLTCFVGSEKASWRWLLHTADCQGHRGIFWEVSRG
jgi:hypothetical protein